jgi:hypothetical protein
VCSGRAHPQHAPHQEPDSHYRTCGRSGDLTETKILELMACESGIRPEDTAALGRVH